jgi:hypothetical protein
MFVRVDRALFFPGSVLDLIGQYTRFSKVDIETPSDSRQYDELLSMFSLMCWRNAQNQHTYAKEGRKEAWRKEGWMDGRKEARKEGWMEGWMEGRKGISSHIFMYTCNSIRSAGLQGLRAIIQKV